MIINPLCAPSKFPTDLSVFEHLWSNPYNIPDDQVPFIDGISGKKYNRKDLKRDCQRVAYTYKSLGLKPGDVVCLFSPNSLVYPPATLAAQCGGYVFTGANVSYTVPEFSHQVSDSNAAIVLVHPFCLQVALESFKSLGWSKQDVERRAFLAILQEDLPKGFSIPGGFKLKTFDFFLGNNLLEPVKIAKPAETVAYIGYSSGTSGKAKGVKLSHINAISVTAMSAEHFYMGPHDRQIAFLPLNHIYGQANVLHGPIFQGHSVVLMPAFDLVSYLSLIQKYKCTISLVVPPIALLLSKEAVVDQYDLSTLNTVFSGAAPLGKELELAIEKRMPHIRVLQGYGMTETSPATHLRRRADDVKTIAKHGSIGGLLGNLRARIVDPVSGQDLGVNQEGELWLQGPNIMLGYLNNPTATAETLTTDKDGVWLRTGDVALVDKDGCFFITDRIKELIKYKGFQVAPAELEASLLTNENVADVAVIGIYVEEMATELPRAYVVLSEAGKKLKDPSKTIQEQFNSTAANHKKLRGGVRIVDIIPKSPSGKILRRLLRDEAKKEQASKPKL